MEHASQFPRKTLHARVAEVLRQDILTSYQPGQRLEGEVKLAQRLGVSPLTVRQAFTALAHEGLLERRHGSGTYVAQELERPYVAVFAEDCEDVRNTDFQMRVFRLCGSLLRERGQLARLFVMPERGGDEIWYPFYRDVARGQVCGALFIALNPAGRLGSVLAETGLPFLSTSNALRDNVQIDYEALVCGGARDLLERGCRRLAVMGWDYSVSDESSARRRAGFQAVTREYGVTVQESWLRWSVPPNVPGAGWEQFRDLWAARAEKPDGLLVLDDVLFRDVALGILDSQIQVPAQLQVATHANAGSGVTYPFPVTLLEIDPREYAQAMVELLLKRMTHEPAEAQVRLIQPRLIPAATVRGEVMRAP